MLYLDLETYSELDLRKVSVDRYASHPSTRILMCAYAGEDGPVELWQEGEPGLDELQDRMRAETCVAWNVAFERTLTGKVWKLGGLDWRDTMVDALYAGLPAMLKNCAKVPYFAGMSVATKESLLIAKFCKPPKTGARKGPDTDPDDWAAFCDYCKRDVADTRLIAQWLRERFTLPERVMKAWELDQRINTTGMPVDRLMTYRAWEEAQRLHAVNDTRLKDLTGLENPNSPKQLLAWLTERGYPFTSLAKEMVKKALNEEPDAEDKLTDDED